MMKRSIYDFGSKRLNHSRVFSKFYSDISCNSAPGKDYALSERGPARTRFAPSPTGYIHLGSLRTALFNFLVAKASGGQFILRIEDTDKKRTVPDAIQRIYEDLNWAGIKWDEGPDLGGPFGPYQQSKRLTIYAEHANQLLESGNAYRCFCSPSRLESLALYQTQQGLAKAYDRYCTSNSKRDSYIRSANGEAHTIRLKAPSKYPPFRDTVYGFVKQREKPQSLQSFDDPILIKSDGFPTYHFANVVDDHLMQITNVIRGAEWISSTHMHLALYQAFGWDPPTFSHVGLLLNKSKQKLSKRNGSQYIADFRSEGIFPETLTNFAALLGWSHREKSDTMSMKDLIKNVRYQVIYFRDGTKYRKASMKFTKGDSVVCYDKLNFLQRRHAARYASLPPSDQPLHSLYHLAVVPIYRELEYRSKLEDLTTYSKIPPGESRRNFIQQVLQADSSNYTNPKEFIDRNIYFFVAPSKKTLRENMSSNIKIYEPHDSNEVDVETLLILFRTINEIDLDEWEIEILRKRVNWIIEQRTEIITESETEKVGISSDLKSRKETLKSWSKFVHEYLRWALCAGKENVSERLRRAETLVRSRTVELVETGSNQTFPEIK
ncbi:Glutamate--tRNA ligase, mitochondrial [Golovinomyces cichoracearum]|uniref:Glutamate--tRNA ligase, mitochondrial n=1 Tax=Golovinomyces cichoracearum TaxID=62708 RepID=A0A420HKH2_9PEZI|nr:Glutamate--tRNA ligase, mitochondrial [Golovinomyces cichoracearum]